MDKKIFIEKVYQNIEAFYAMTLASAAISSYNSEESDEDSAKVISFIGNAYKLDEEFIGKCKEEILGNMMGVALISDYLALNAVDMMDKEDIERLELYEIKGRAIEEVNRMECQECIFKDSRTSPATRNRMNYEAFHHPYNAKFRYFNISRLADNGDLTATRQLGLLSALGIGCEKDYEKAEKMFLRCVFWSDKVSVKLLSYLYCLQNKKDKEEIFENLYLLNKEDRKTYGYSFREDSQADIYRYLIKLIKDNLIFKSKNSVIDIAFTDVISDEEIGLEEKIICITEYQKRLWQQAGRLSQKNNHIGFRVKKNV